jgi:flagellar assembly protein FliH
MASPLIPKEQLSAYQRWELGSFDQPRVAGPIDPVSAAEHQRQLEEQRRAQGYAAGYREGLEAARREGAVQTNLHLERLDQMLAAFGADLLRIEHELAQDVLQLGLAVAHKLVGELLRVRPEAVRDTVEDALRHIAHIRSPVSVIVHPHDAPLIRAYLETATPRDAWSLREDAGIAHGGCRVETSVGDIDATVEQRWHRITTALGQPVGWVE